MVTNPGRIEKVERGDIGRPVSMQIMGSSAIYYGYISGLSELKGRVFIRWIGEHHDTLELLQDCRFGHVPPWLGGNRSD